jgi:hypothetical protein
MLVGLGKFQTHNIKIILDLIVMNGTGIYLGYLFVKHFKVKRLHFLIKSLKSNESKSRLTRLIDFFDITDET